jgi:hypothetical protein
MEAALLGQFRADVRCFPVSIREPSPDCARLNMSSRVPVLHFAGMAPAALFAAALSLISPANAQTFSRSYKSTAEDCRAVSTPTGQRNAIGETGRAVSLAKQQEPTSRAGGSSRASSTHAAIAATRSASSVPPARDGRSPRYSCWSSRSDRAGSPSIRGPRRDIRP